MLARTLPGVCATMVGGAKVKSNFIWMAISNGPLFVGQERRTIFVALGILSIREESTACFLPPIPGYRR